ncbi:MAG: hypothetical protein NDJ90_02560 [Oligoflexia bacterium]|nr:hypothetical protein [Oligoflexia bacterium]
MEQTSDQKFKAWVLSWDQAIAQELEQPDGELPEALQHAVETGTLCALIAPSGAWDPLKSSWVKALSKEGRGRLLVCAGEGAEVFGFTEDGRQESRFSYAVRPEEQLELGRVAEAVRRMLLEVGLPVEVAHRGPSRVSIDLLPNLPAGAPETAATVQDRLKGVGFKRGMAEVLERVERLASEASVPKLRTQVSEGKFLEVGLSAQGDFLRWLKGTLLEPRGIRPEEVLVVGHDFGGVGGVPGKDAQLCIPGFEEAVFVSVGEEPEGAPPRIVHLGGGNRKVAELLREGGEEALAKVRVRGQKESTHLRANEWARTRDVNWIITQQGFNPSDERERETVFAIGNGYAGVRGSVNLLIPGSQADLFLAGVYDAKASDVPYSEAEFLTGADRDEPFPELVSFPFPFQLRLGVGGRELSPWSPFLRDYERQLDLKRSVLFERFDFKDDLGRETEIRTMRCCSLADPHLLLHEVEITCVNHHDGVEADAELSDPDIRLRHPHLVSVRQGRDGELSDLTVFETKASKVLICFAGRTSLDGQEVSEPKVIARPERGRPLVLRRLISIHTSRDVPDPVGASCSHALSRQWRRFGDYVEAHAERWAEFWNAADIEVVGNPAVSGTLRFNSYHLRIAAPDDPRASLGARTLSGRAYEGHIFWDAEVFMLPFFVHTVPHVARSLLRYRHSTLNGARERARRLGYEGACYAWESTASGLDATPKTISLKGTDATVPIFTGTQQIHVTGGVSHAVLQYWDSTGDEEFVRAYGAEILFETARFWGSRATERKGRYHILGVVGPDEYHHGVNDNAYTNWMARENLAGAVRVARWLQAADPTRWQELVDRLGLGSGEVSLWQDMAERLFIPQPNAEGVIPQFEGFFDLKDVPLTAEEQYRAPFERLLKWKDVNSSKLLKQADLLMIPFLFPQAYPTEVVRANYRYYERITDHGSSLSPCIHAAIASRIGEHEAASRYWQAGLNLDLLNLMKNTALGFHAACAGGTWQALVFHILGIEFQEDSLREGCIRPIALPVEGREVRLRLHRRGQTIPCVIPVLNRRSAA